MLNRIMANVLNYKNPQNHVNGLRMFSDEQNKRTFLET